MNNNSIIKTLKPSTLIYAKNHKSYIGFDDTKSCIISQGFYYMKSVKYISKTIGNEKFTIRATHIRSKIVCVGFLSYYLLNGNCTELTLLEIASNYYNTHYIEYNKDKMDSNKAKTEFPDIHLAEENEFFEYAKKNFFGLLPKCDITTLSDLANSYFDFIKTKQICKQTDEIHTKTDDHSSNNQSYDYDSTLISNIYKYLAENDINENAFPFSSFCKCIEDANFEKLFILPNMRNKTRYLIGFLNKFIKSSDKTKDWYLISARSISCEKLKCGNGANVSESWKNKLNKIKPDKK